MFACRALPGSCPSPRSAVSIFLELFCFHEGRIANEILMYLRSTKNNRNDVYLQDPVGVDKEGNEVTLLDLLGSDGNEIIESLEASEEQAYLLDKLSLLSQEEQFVLLYRYGLKNQEKRTQREIAKELGISRSYVSRIEKRAVQKLLKVMER